MEKRRTKAEKLEEYSQTLLHIDGKTSKEVLISNWENISSVLNAKIKDRFPDEAEEKRISFCFFCMNHALTWFKSFCDGDLSRGQDSLDSLQILRADLLESEMSIEQIVEVIFTIGYEQWCRINDVY